MKSKAEHGKHAKKQDGEDFKHALLYEEVPHLPKRRILG